MKTFEDFIRCLLGGILIGLGGTAYLCCENKYVATLLFAFGLTAILVFSLGLFTGRAGNLPKYGVKYIPTLFLTVAGNFTGCALMGFYANYRGLPDVFSHRLEAPLWVVFINAVFCGILMYVAVEGYAQTKNFFVPVICIPTFIIAGFEHSVADIFFMCAAGTYTAKAAVFMIVAVLGNLVGCSFLPFCRKYGLKENI